VHGEPRAREVLKPIVKSNNQYIQKIVMDTFQITVAATLPFGETLNVSFGPILLKKSEFQAERLRVRLSLQNPFTTLDGFSVLR
jgi:hypothetical protein